MIQRTDPLPVLPGDQSFPAMMVTIWAVLATVGLIGLASTPPSASVGQARVASSSVRTAVTPTASSGSLTAALGVPAQPANPLTTGTGTARSATAAPTGGAQPASPAATSDANGRVVVALRAALAQIGLPYVWGGNGPSGGDAGFDCSGLTHFAYAVAGIALPRTAHTQFYAGPHVPGGAPLQPGDLVFYGTPTFVHHVGMYVGAGRMVNAPTFGEPVQIAYYRWPGDDYIGATRPDGSSATGLLTLPFIAEAVGPPPIVPQGRKSDVFVAPRAPLPAALPALGAVQMPQIPSVAAAVSPASASAPVPALAPAPVSAAIATSSLAPTSDPTKTAGSTPSGSTAPSAAVPTSEPVVGPAAPAGTVPPATTNPQATAVLPIPQAAPTRKKAPATKAAPVVTTTPPTRTKTAVPSPTTTTAASPDPTKSAASAALITTTTPTPTPTPTP